MKPAPTETASGYLPRIRFVRLALSMTGWLTCFLTLSCGRQEAGTSERMEGARNAQTFESANDHNTKAETDQLGPGAELPRYELEMATSDFEGMENSHCIDRVIESFLESGDEKKIDLSCVPSMKPAPITLK